MKAKKRPKIGVMVGNFHSDHPRRLVGEIWRLLHESDVDVRFYLGTESSSFMSGFAMQESKYDYQYVSLYSYSRYDNLDLLVLSMGTMGIYHDTDAMRRLDESLPDIPCVRLETVYGRERDSNIIIDNYQGIESCTEHLIIDHGCKDIAFVTGPEGNRDSEERLESFLNTMKKHDLPIGEGRIIHGDFSEHVDRQVEALFEKKPYPEAIVSANDEMAMSIYRVSRNHGLTPGKDILVTGFDDWEMAGFMDPPLTTARQDYEAIASASVEHIFAHLRGENPGLQRIPAKLIRRCSCGCSAVEEQIGEDEERATLIDSVWRQKNNQQKSWIGALLNRELLEASNVKNFYYRLGTSLHYLDVSRANVYLFEKPQYVPRGEVIRLVPYLLRPMEYTKNRRAAYTLEEAPKIPLDNKGIEKDAKDRASCAMVFLLFFEKYQYGTLHLEIDPSEIDFYYMLSLEVGSSIRYLYLSMQQRAYQEDLKEKNQILDFTAHHDELTRVYNRTGIITKTLEMFRRKSDRNFAVLMADLDHLKQINDTFGHPEGDYAIRSTAKILSRVMEDEDAIIGRTGGDEFVAVFSIKPPNDIRYYIQKLHEKCAEFNAQSDRPYYVEVSGGGVVFRASDGYDLQNLLSKADVLLYEDKKKRRESVIRPDRNQS